MPSVYPRVCGGTSRAGERSQRCQGLSPRVRGNPGTRGLYEGPYRSIPACAGEPASSGPAQLTYKVYPRVCGGTRVGVMIEPFGERSIPACAGEPLPARPWPVGSQVYPRVCGGTARGMAILDGYRGLSPRVRGNHPVGSWCVNPSRSIPACAGEPRLSRAVR